MMTPSWKSNGRVLEIQGLYGPLQVLENRIQQVWALQLCQPGQWFTSSGRKLGVIEPGRWNRGSGPDFREAILELDGERISGDVELHLYREDWWRHGHHLDPAFSGVILHVVLFAGGMERPIKCLDGKCTEEWVLGPWLREDIESVTGGDPGLFGEFCPELREWLEEDGPESASDRLHLGADRRWQDKVSLARCLLTEFGWEGALHRIVLFYLGVPYNRRSFYAIAECYPPQSWRSRSLPSLIRSEWDSPVQWNLGRPANRPIVRLRQYQALHDSSPNWMSRLETPLLKLGPHTMPGEDLQRCGTRSVRRKLCLPDWIRWLDEVIHGGALNAGLRNRLWIDAYLPLLAVHGRIEGQRAALLWQHSHAASFPDAYRDLLADTGITGRYGQLLSNSLIQGLFWAEDQLRLERVRRSLG